VRLSIKLRRLAFVVGGCVMFLMPSPFFVSSSSFSWGFPDDGFGCGTLHYSFFLDLRSNSLVCPRNGFQFCSLRIGGSLYTLSYLSIFIFSSSSLEVTCRRCCAKPATSPVCFL
jgi:hypothetical protein